MKPSRILCMMVLPLLLMATALLSPPNAHALDPVPIPAWTGPITLPTGSHAFEAADYSMENIDLRASGYVQEEYFISGMANVYNWNAASGGGFGTTVQSANAPYTTRVLVMRPIDHHRFSGNVVIEWVNPTNTWDLARMWYASWAYFLRHGDIYVGLTAKPVDVLALQAFNPVRYAPLNWTNPLPNSDPRKCTPTSTASFKDTEDGLIWDIGSQLAALLKSPSTPLFGFRAQHVYATAHSQTASYLETYINFFHKNATMPDGSTVYDGYLLHGAGGLTVINQCAKSIPSSDPRTILVGSSAPIFNIHSYTDFNSGSARAGYWPDSDDPNDRYRLYELAGPSHNWLYVAYFPPSENDLNLLNPPYFQTIYRCEPNLDSIPPGYANDFPSHYLLNGAYRNMYRWVERGILPPKEAERIQVNAANAPVLDEFGNPVGGVRTPYVDVPTATYTPGPTQDKPAFAGTGKCSSWGSMIPFSAGQLKALYKNHGQYVRKVGDAVDELVKNGWVTQEDAASMKAAAAQSRVPDAPPALIKPKGTLYPWPDTYAEWVAAGEPSGEVRPEREISEHAFRGSIIREILRGNDFFREGD